MNFDAFKEAAKQVPHLDEISITSKGDSIEIIVVSYLANDESGFVDKASAVCIGLKEIFSREKFLTPGSWLMETFERGIKDKHLGFTRYATVDEVQAFKRKEAQQQTRNSLGRMKLVALCGAAGAGKDTVADMLPARKLAFADVLYQEVAEAFGVSVERLKARDTKEVPSPLLPLMACKHDEFVVDTHFNDDWCVPRSPRQILQWWGDYRRAHDPDYFVKRTRQELINWDWATPGSAFVVTDVRFANEAAMIRALGGELWQIQRTGVQAGGTGHKSDTDGSEFKPERVIHNHGTLEDLRAAVTAAWDAMSAEGK